LATAITKLGGGAVERESTAPAHRAHGAHEGPTVPASSGARRVPRGTEDVRLPGSRGSTRSTEPTAPASPASRGPTEDRQRSRTGLAGRPRGTTAPTHRARERHGRRQRSPHRAHGDVPRRTDGAPAYRARGASTGNGSARLTGFMGRPTGDDSAASPGSPGRPTGGTDGVRLAGSAVSPLAARRVLRLAAQASAAL
jgi:hypothetical protein